MYIRKGLAFITRTHFIFTLKKTQIKNKRKNLEHLRTLSFFIIYLFSRSHQICMNFSSPGSDMCISISISFYSLALLAFNRMPFSHSINTHKHTRSPYRFPDFIYRRYIFFSAAVSSQTNVLHMIYFELSCCFFFLLCSALFLSVYFQFVC